MIDSLNEFPAQFVTSYKLSFRSGEEGKYPELEEFTEKVLAKQKPKRYFSFYFTSKLLCEQF